MRIRMKIFKNYDGSAIMLTLFLLSAIMLIVFGGASVIVSGLKMGSVQSQSTRAYFAAEAGAERLLYEFRHSSNFENLDKVGMENVFGTTTLASGSTYTVNYDSFIPQIIFTSIGSYESTKRSVELNF